MKTGFSIPVRAVAAAALAALVAVVFVGLPSSTEATSHSATREFSSSWVLPGGEFSVTITFDNLGLGQVAESLPEGFTYLRSDLGGVEVEGQFLTIFIIGDSSVTYTVTAPDTEGEFTFTGVVRDLNGDEELIGGDSSIRVGPPPTPVPPTFTAYAYADVDSHQHPHADSDAHVDAHASADGHANADPYADA